MAIIKEEGYISEEVLKMFEDKLYKPKIKDVVRMNAYEEIRVKETMSEADVVVAQLEEVLKCLNSANHCGILVLLSNMIPGNPFRNKKMAKYEELVKETSCSLQVFSAYLREISDFPSINARVSPWIGEFPFEGMLVNIFKKNQNADAKWQCDETIRKVQIIRSVLVSLN